VAKEGVIRLWDLFECDFLGLRERLSGKRWKRS
jgi:hypothetical protein